MFFAKDESQKNFIQNKRLSTNSKPRLSLYSVKNKAEKNENEGEIFKIQARILNLDLYKGKSQEYFKIVQQADSLFKCFQYEESIKLYKQAIIFDAKSNFAQVNLSASYISIGSYKKALDTLETTCLKKDEFIVGMFNKALSLVLLKQFNTASSILASIENYMFADMQQDLQCLINYCIKQSDLFMTPSLKLTKSKTILSNFKFPYVNSSDRVRKGSEFRNVFNNSPGFGFGRSNFPRPLVKISNAYKNFVVISKKRTSNIVEKLMEQNEITGDEINDMLKVKPSKVAEVSNKISEFVGNVKDKKNVESVLNNQLTTQAIREIRYEYCKPSPVRNYSKISSHLKSLSFFSKFPEPIISEIVKKSELETFLEGQLIISQGDLGDKMFIILTGIINVMKKSDEFGGMEIQVNTLYQGETFGEMALLAQSENEKLKRSASCVAGQETILIVMSKTDYKHILLYMMKNDIHGKASFFCSLPLFPGTDHYGMVPLAANIEPESYSINEIILETGEMPKGLYIIYEGRCTIQWEGYIMRRKSGNRKALTKAPKPFLTDRVLKFSESRQKILTEVFDPSDSQQVSRACQYLGTDRLDAVLQKYEIYKKSIELYKLARGDFFGGRALSGRDNQVPAKFTVVADSLDVKVFIFTFKYFSLLPETVIVNNT